MLINFTYSKQQWTDDFVSFVAVFAVSMSKKSPGICAKRIRIRIASVVL
jgi:hypothetical protein